MALRGRARLSLLIIFLSSLLLQSPAFAAKKAYVVYLGAHNHASPDAALLAEESVVGSHHELLASVLRSKESAKDAIIYSYTKQINGFAANLDEQEAAELSKHPSVVSVFPNRGHKLHTTHSWDFLRLERDGRVPEDSFWTKARFGEDTIIANLDTGVWPESQSFSDEGMGPVPSRWRGACQKGNGEAVKCNRKLIGARYFNKGYEAYYGKLNKTFHSPRDLEGHGSHTLSTAGGNFVANVSLFGYGKGTAKGGSPKARVAAYKVCWPSKDDGSCFDIDILAAFDAALHDGVDVLSLSLGGEATDYFIDGIAIGSFHAILKGIPVVCSAGNSGPSPGSASNTAPWILTVGASTIDRQFPAYALFKDQRIKGQSLSARGLPHKKYYPMISSADASADKKSNHDAQLCFLNSLDPEKVKGKIVVCLRGITARVEKGLAVLQAGGAGMILANDESSGNELISDPHVLPATQITYSDGLKVFAYLNSTKSPLGYITPPKTALGTKPAPFMAAFSSQGPNTVSPQILKPDITAPGVDIIAAYTGASSATELPFDKRHVAYDLMSGTSMSCPHIAGVVGLLKTLQPSWSPAMIRSAIMTTARVRDNNNEAMQNASFVEATPFSYGAGHVRPNRVMDPGLVYDITPENYLNFLCASGYNKTEMSAFSKAYKCPCNPPKLEDLNYPSITVPNLSDSTTVTRTVTNVGTPGTYTVYVHAPKGVLVAVYPTTLKFEKFGEEKKFEITIKAECEAPKDYVFGSLTWTDGKHYVRSPLVVKATA